jgi:hypothetical protein
VQYRAAGEWPGVVRLETDSGVVRELTYKQFVFPYGEAFAPPRCRMCPDALNELADISMGDTDFDRTNRSSHHVIARTRVGEALLGSLRSHWITLTAASEDDVFAAQEHTRYCKRNVLRGRWWLRRVAARALPSYPGVDLASSWRDDRSSHVIARTRVGEALLGTLRSHWITLTAASEDDVFAAQEHTRYCKRNVLRGRWWLRRVAGRALPSYPGVDIASSWRDRTGGFVSLGKECVLRCWAGVRYPPHSSRKEG